MQSPTNENSSQQQLSCPQLPLAVYREVSAHLRQVEGVDASLIIRPLNHDPAEKFDYYQSQVAALRINYSENTDELARQQVQEILDYYAQRYRPWEMIFVHSTS
jgi:protein associated with RNAse G/E